MIQYILETIVIQLVFLLVYDLFLKKETFFQRNRAYLLGTFILSLFLPWIKIEAFKTVVPENLVQYQQFFWQLDEVVLFANNSENGFWENINWGYIFLGAGALIMTIWLAAKLNRIYKLKKSGIIFQEKDFIKVIVPKSEQAFSFFRNVFMGADIPNEKQENILAHEMVHVKQRHSMDLMFFEVMRIVFWFNPLVYVYQNRISELHEFIADAQASKTDKKKQYELLLSEVFQSQNFSLVNQFHKKSLIKKRIVMLTREKSKAIYQFKYAMLLPLLLGMLLYTSCEKEEKIEKEAIELIPLDGTVVVALKDGLINFEVENLDNLTTDEKQRQEKLLEEVSKSKITTTIIMNDKVGNSAEFQMKEGTIFSMSVNKQSGSTLNLEENASVPFGVIEEAPIFPGCEDAVDKRKCFQEKMQRHIRKNFRYPEEAHKLGVQGKVYIIFKISKDGTITNIRTRGPHKSLEDEAQRIIKRLPQMQPGKQKGEVVEVPFSIPITFKLQ
ncbi:M56 family metallopeptidase [Flagellimonas pacifica]|uniref:TonB family C-terminal domain-containing protein n=1 Tax=Flagellimonas pacifica TaxID=1247520 RepID=A0A285MVM8_9FLAO|nr:M56 family metallopeptidase [Allomuricauda parva]SNZ01250.1 TonB family C-terminal domain-containing protein [Allomuricauda parva]